MTYEQFIYKCAEDLAQGKRSKNEIVIEYPFMQRKIVVEIKNLIVFRFDVFDREKFGDGEENEAISLQVQEDIENEAISLQVKEDIEKEAKEIENEMEGNQEVI